MESFWSFILPEQNIVVPFLLVGHTQEPSVSLERSHLNYKALLIGHEAMETVYITNQEKQAFSFAVQESSCHAAGYSASLRVEPMSSIVEPKERYQCPADVALCLSKSSSNWKVESKPCYNMLYSGEDVTMVY